MRVSADGSHLVTGAGLPFFYLADTAWELLHRCDEAESRMYLKDRAAKGINVIQTVILAELEGLTVPSANGHLPLRNLDPARPNEEYFQHVDAVVRLADSLGLYLGLLPTWGDKFNKKWGVGPEVFTPENARTFGRFLGERYRNNNVIWILGGDRIPEEPEDFAIVRAMAAGLRAAVDRRQLITYHPQGGYKSSDYFPNDDWLDFHMFQSGHGGSGNKLDYKFPPEVLAEAPGKPVINGEPCYEDHPINWRPVNGWFTDFDTRRAAYWSVLAGTAGHTFGNHSIWQMWQPGRAPISSARTDWRTALRYPGVRQMGYLRRLMEGLPFWELSPDADLFTAIPNSSGRETLVVRTQDTGLVIAYTPYGDRLEIRRDRLPGKVICSWFDPRSGNSIPFKAAQTEDMLLFDPPFEPAPGNDWVLVVRAEDR
ncbi:DUF4038 domain-containing protein [Lewinella sp. 4G2]|uniref:apiosidase-like domain-containing protein n=1 Tax=Lewinella sp. 4G2 TaxID=1803372 RepID=UPI001E43E488|nr:DUF4038 domain-containing protein [Lewinella sp. 4G2]